MNRFRHGWRKAALALAAAAFALLAAGAAPAAPARNAQAKPGDCAACHRAQKVLPAGHVATRGMKPAQCRTCHAPGTPAALDGTLTGAHVHQQAGVTCASCHGKGRKAAEVDQAVCIGCHATAQLAQKTAAVKPNNPHDSKHWGTETDCNLCHHQHAKSENYCAQCHTFAFRVP